MVVKSKKSEKAPEVQKPTTKPIHNAKFFAFVDKLLKNKIFITILMLFWVGFATIATQYALAFVALKIFDRETLNTPVGITVFSAVSYAITLVLVVFVPKKLKKEWGINRDKLGLNGLPTWTDIGLAPIGYVVMFILSSIVTAFFSLFSWFNADEAQEVGYSVGMSDSEKIIAFVSLVVIAPIIEEVIFRGWLYGKLRARYAMPISILLTSILFGIVHLQWNVGVNVFATSVVLCLMREITGTVYSGILLHVLKNGIAFFLLYILKIVI